MVMIRKEGRARLLASFPIRRGEERGGEGVHKG